MSENSFPFIIFSSKPQEREITNDTGISILVSYLSNDLHIFMSNLTKNAISRPFNPNSDLSASHLTLSVNVTSTDWLHKPKRWGLFQKPLSDSISNLKSLLLTQFLSVFPVILLSILFLLSVVFLPLCKPHDTPLQFLAEASFSQGSITIVNKHSTRWLFYCLLSHEMSNSMTAGTRSALAVTHRRLSNMFQNQGKQKKGYRIKMRSNVK